MYRKESIIVSATNLLVITNGLCTTQCQKKFDMLLITIKENIKVHHRASYDRNVCCRYSSSLLRQQTAFIMFLKMVPQENKHGSFIQQNLTNMPLSQGDQLQLMKST